MSSEFQVLSYDIIEENHLESRRWICSSTMSGSFFLGRKPDDTTHNLFSCDCECTLIACKSYCLSVVYIAWLMHRLHFLCSSSFSLDFSQEYPSRIGSTELVVLRQPEAQHRPRYETEGSRGRIKDRCGSSCPAVQVRNCIVYFLLNVQPNQINE